MSLSEASLSSGLNNPQRTYLLTYSAIDPEIFPTRQSFGEACAEAFGNCVDYYAVCKEQHTTDGEHYHASFKLTKPRRWGAPKKHLMSQYNAVVNFREPDENNCMYIGAYRYITKEDKEVFHSPGHPALDRIKTSRTLQGVQAYVQKRQSMSDPKLNEAAKKPKQSQSKKPRMMTNLELCDFIIKHNIKSEKELYAVASERRADGENDLAEYVTRFPKRLNDIIASAWKLMTANSVKEKRIPRMDRIKLAAAESCVAGCNGQ